MQKATLHTLYSHQQGCSQNCTPEQRMLPAFVRLYITIHAPSSHSQLLPPVLPRSLLAPWHLNPDATSRAAGQDVAESITRSLKGARLHFHEAFAESRKDSLGQRKCKSSWLGV